MPKDLLPSPPTDPGDFLGQAAYLLRVTEINNVSVANAAAKLGINSRKAHYLVEIANAIDGLDIPDDRLRKIGWTKLSVIVPRLSAETAEELLSAAEKHKVPDLQAIVAGREPPSRRHVMKFDLDDAQHKIVRAALLAHGATRSTRGLHGKEAALVAALNAARG